MAKPLNNRPVVARVNADLRQQMDDYVKATEEMTMGKLIRLAIRDYLWAHPNPTENPNTPA